MALHMCHSATNGSEYQRYTPHKITIIRKDTAKTAVGDPEKVYKMTCYTKTLPHNCQRSADQKIVGSFTAFFLKLCWCMYNYLSDLHCHKLKQFQ